MAKGKYEYWMNPEGILRLEAYARDGLTDEEIAKKLDISTSTLYEWKKKYPEISEALKKGKEIPDIEVENKLFESACGIKVTVKKPIKVKEVIFENGKKVKEIEKVVQAEEEIYIPPQVTAQIFWLKNRKPDTWKQKVEGNGNAAALERLDDVLAQIGGVVGGVE